jgi:hypothetical protein
LRLIVSKRLDMPIVTPEVKMYFCMTGHVLRTHDGPEET